VEAFALTMENMQKIFFTWPDETRFYPGHDQEVVLEMNARFLKPL
jgi:glyoxylase-like metal-dependent hydrolase (beta-lactamase superfamily II)